VYQEISVPKLYLHLESEREITPSNGDWHLLGKSAIFDRCPRARHCEVLVVDGIYDVDQILDPTLEISHFSFVYLMERIT